MIWYCTSSLRLSWCAALQCYVFSFHDMGWVTQVDRVGLMYLHHEMSLPPSAQCHSAVPPLVSPHNFMLIWNHKFRGLTWSLQRVQTIDSVSACLPKHFLSHLLLSLWSRNVKSNQCQRSDVLDVPIGICWFERAIRFKEIAHFLVHSFEIHWE